MPKPDYKKLDLSPDTELFCAVGNEWTLPLWVRWGIEKKSKEIYGVITPASGLYPQQELTLNALFENQDIQGLTSSWIVPREVIHGLLKKAAGVKPQAYYQADPSMPFFATDARFRRGTGGGVDLNSISTNPVRNTDDQRMDFSKYVSHQYAIPVSTVRAVMDAFTAEAPKWMIEFRRPLNLGFCTLIAVPFRKNWIQIIAQKYREYPLLGILSRSNRREILREIMMPESLCSPQNIGLRVNRGQITMDYTLEVIPTNRFEVKVNAVGLKRQSDGTTVKDFESTVESLYELLLKALETYLRKINLPFGKIHQSSPRSQPRLLPTRGDIPTVSGVGLGKLPVYIIPPGSGFSVTAESRVENVVLSKAKIVPKVPFVQPGDGDLRQREEFGNVERSEDGATETDRVPLPVPSEGEPAVE